MIGRLTCVLAVLGLLGSLPLSAQQGGRPVAPEPRPEMPHGANMPRANQGHLPPPPLARSDRTAPPRPEIDERNRINNHPHVSHDEWYGHDRPDDPRFHLDHPWPAGHFTRFGPSYRYAVTRFDRERHRFWFAGGFGFEVAPWDWILAAEWCWTCGDDFIVYDDPDHPGWYLLYNIYTGAYIHVQYLGT
jgi:hypothetical protein